MCAYVCVYIHTYTKLTLVCVYVYVYMCVYIYIYIFIYVYKVVGVCEIRAHEHESCSTSEKSHFVTCSGYVVPNGVCASITYDAQVTRAATVDQRLLEQRMESMGT